MVRKATRIGVLGNYLPRRCGIATFTGDLCDSLAAEEPSGFISVAAVNDTREGYKYPERVRFQIAQNKLLDYLNAAAFFNIANFDVLCVQHEFGIFGGAAGDMVLAFMRELRMPVITTLHTVLADPDKFQRAAMEGIAKLSDRLVVMSAKGAEFLRSTYGISDDKIALIPHGVPDVPFVDPNYYKDLFGVEGRRVLLTFGLLSPNKGIENVIRALPPVVQKHPDVVYIIVGATHPHVLREKGEEYRFVLQGLVRTLDLGSHVMFHDRFVEVEELHAFLGCADICLTPYLNEAQIVSGALSFCLGAGKAVVSTPYWHAREILADERGVLVPFGDSRAVTQVLLHLLKNDVERHAMRKRAYSFARKMIWRRCAREYLTLFAKVLQEREKAPRKFSAAARIYGDTLHVPSLDFTHLKRLTDSTGIIQHAKYTIPDRGHGYCTDDNARALVVAVRGARLLEESEELDELNELAAIYLSFLDHAFVPESGRFHNFMGYDRCWTDQTGTEDAHGRALWGLGVAAARAAEPGVVSLATRLFIAALPAALTLNSPRSMALSLIGIHEYLRRFSGDVEAHRVREKLAAAIFDSFQRHGTGDWPWPEETLTYINARLPQSLLLAGQWIGRPDMIDTAIRALDFLLAVQKCPEGHFAPIGNKGWYKRGGQKARFDQQPVEAQATLEACVGAWHVTGAAKWLTDAGLCYEWFLGRNDIQASLYDHATGGCRDGLQPDGASRNEGAESLLSWLLSAITMAEVKAQAATAEVTDSGAAIA